MIRLGWFTAGETPEPLAYTFQNADGATLTDIDEPTWGVVFRFSPRGSDMSTEREGTVVDGVATHTWEDGDITGDGAFDGEFTATDGVNTFISERISWYVRVAIVEPAS